MFSIIKMRKWAAKRMRALMLIILGFFLISCFYFYGAYAPSSQKGGTPEKEEDLLTAKVNNEEISKSQFYSQFSQMVQYLQSMYPNQIKGVNLERIKANTLDQMIDRALLLQTASQQKIKVSKGEINKEIDKLSKNFPSRDEFEKRMKALGYTTKRLGDSIKEDLLVQNLQKEIKKKVQVSAEDVKKEYEQVRVRHILFQLPIALGNTEEEKKKNQKRQEENLKKKGEEVLLELKAGADFAELAKRDSDCPSKDKGGDLGFFGRGRMDPAFEKAAFSLKIGEVSGLVKTKFGYHIIKSEEKKEAEGPDFKKEKKKIKKELLERKQNEEYNKWFENLKKKAKIKILDNQISAYKFSEEGKWAQAIVKYKKAIEKNPDDPYLYYSLGQAYLRKDKIDEAILQYKKALEIVSADADFHFALGEAYQKKKDEDKAYGEYKEAGKLAGDDLFLHFRLQNAYQEMGKTKEVVLEKKEIERIQKEEQKRQKAMQERIKKVKIKGGKMKEEKVKKKGGEKTK